ncbi:MAG: PilZ domain-containing protein [Pirellulaceae bacterium]
MAISAKQSRELKMFGEGLESQKRGGLDAVEALLSLDKSSDKVFQAQRAHARFESNSTITIKAANASQREDINFSAICNDISAGGCRVLSNKALMVGDLFFLVFERGQLDVPPVFARCLRCRFLREETFEMGFAFLTPVELPRGPVEDDSDSLL